MVVTKTKKKTLYHINTTKFGTVEMSSLELPWGTSSGHMYYYKYLKRLVRIQHLEFDSAFQQILWILINPKRV